MLMTYKLVFKIDAKKEWDNLDLTVRSVFAKKLKERIQQPRIESSRLSGMKDCYKIKLRRAGFRLVYQVRDKELVVSVVAVGKRERNLVYKIASKRI
jgi:mRNA interferase RelE/StbE